MSNLYNFEDHMFELVYELNIFPRIIFGDPILTYTEIAQEIFLCFKHNGVYEQ